MHRHVFLCLCAVTAAFDVHAAPVSNLETGQPLQITDSFPVALNTGEAETVVRWDRQENGKDLFMLEPAYVYGIAPYCQARLALPFSFESGNDGLESVSAQGLCNFFHEPFSEWSWAISAELTAPRNKRENRGLDWGAGLIGTYTIPQTRLAQRVHLNGMVWHNTDALKKQRRNYFAGRIGYDVQLTPEVLCLADFVRQASIWKDTITNRLEAGVRRKLTEQWLVFFGGGIGLSESRTTHVVAGADYSF